MDAKQIIAKPMNVHGGAERVVESIHSFTGAECYSIHNRVQGEIYNQVGSRSEAMKVSEEFHDVEEFASKKIELAQILTEKDVIRDTDLAIFHFPIAASITDDIDFERSVLYNHTASRRLTFLFDEYNSFKNGVEGLAMEKFRPTLMKKYRELYRKPDVVVSNSEFIKNMTEKYFGVESEVIHPPVNVEKFNPDGYSATGDYYISVQRFDWTKKIHEQVEAFRELDEKLVIVGGESSVLSYLVKDDENITYLGYIDDEMLVKYLRGAKALITTSLEEDFGLTPVEAMACGTPVIAVDEGGYSYTVSSDTGILFDRGGLTEAVKKFEAEDYSSNFLREEALKYSTENFQEKFERVLDESY